MSHQIVTQTPCSTLPVCALADEIATLSALIQAATYRLLCLVEEFDRRSGWADSLDSNGFRSCAHWLSWRVGLSLGTARQQVRVARALPKLPRIAAAFATGELSYSKVRAITRVADPDNEEMLLQWAQAGTAAQVERIVRKYRRANRAQENAQALEQARTRQLVTHFDDDGMLVIRGRLPPEQGALLMKALDRCTDELHAAERGSAEPRSGTDVRDGDHKKADGDQRRADALARMAERALAASAGEAVTADRYQVVVHVDAEVLADPSADGRCDLAGGPALAAETARRLACDATVCEMQHGPEGELVAGRKSRVVSPTLLRALQARDGTRCAFPGCPCRGADAHHVQHWANGGPTVLGNLLSLCRYHHTLVHEGGYHVQALPSGRFRFLRPDGREVPAAPPLPEVSGDPVESLAAGWLGPEVRVTPDTGRATWDGEPVDYDWAVELLQVHTPTGPAVHPPTDVT